MTWKRWEKAFSLHSLATTPKQVLGKETGIKLLVLLVNEHQALEGQEFFNMIDCLRDFTDKGRKSAGGHHRKLF